MKTIILDTNFLTIPYKFKVDVFKEIHNLISEEHEITTLDGVVRELEHMSEERGEDASAARIGLELIEKNQVKIILTHERNVDDAIVELANDQTLVATNDKELINRLKTKNVKVIYLRGKNRLVLG